MFSWMSARLRRHFGFSRTETRGACVLLLLIGVCLLVPQGLKWYDSMQPAESHDQDIALLEHTLLLLEAHKQSSKRVYKAFKKELDDPQSMPYFDINAGSEAQLRMIKGLGPVLAARIVKFRNKLGGFISQQQYREVYGLRPEVVESLQKHTYISTSFHPAKLDINTADVKALAAHPYINYQQARSIVRYRAQHGPFAATASLGALALIDQATLEKVNPYLSATQ